MKKKQIKIGDKELTIDVFETEFELLGGMTAREFHAKLDEEQRHDRELDSIADEVAGKLSRAGLETRTIVYWEVGDLILQYMTESIRKDKSKREPYEIKSRALNRLVDKVSERLAKNPGESKEKYSVPYFLKWLRLRKQFARRQAERPVSYSLAHELLYAALGPEDVDTFLDRIERKELQSNTDVRKAVAQFRAEKGLRAVRPDTLDPD